MGSASGSRGAGSRRRDGDVVPLPPPPSSPPRKGYALPRPPQASPRKKHSHSPSPDFMQAWSRAVVRTLPAPPGVRPNRPMVAPLPAPPRPADDEPAAPEGPLTSSKRTRRGIDRRRAAKLSKKRTSAEHEVVVIDSDDDEDDRERSHDGTSTSEPNDQGPRASPQNGHATASTLDLIEDATTKVSTHRAEEIGVPRLASRGAPLERNLGVPVPIEQEPKLLKDFQRPKDPLKSQEPKRTPKDIESNTLRSVSNVIHALLERRKLRLVLDLDHTLLNSATFEDCAADRAGALLESRVAAETADDAAYRSLHRLTELGLWTKTRPGVRTFLRRAAQLFEIHICTAGSQAYAERMRALLDPTRELVKGSVVGLATFNEFGIPEPGEVVKTMARELRGSEPIAIVLDDTAAVWPGHVENLIVCERYVYFPSCARKFGMVTPSLLERRVDESANRGMLATAFDVLQRVHSDFFARRAAHREFTLKRSREGAALVAAPDDDDDAYVGGSAAARLRADASARRALLGSSRRESPPPYAFPVTVPELLTQEKRRVLRGTELVFSGVVPSGTDPSRHPLWRLAEAFGARCVKIPSDAATTHVVVEPANLGPGGTDKMIWATRLGKYVVTPGWVLTSAASFQRADEDAFAARR